MLPKVKAKYAAGALGPGVYENIDNEAYHGALTSFPAMSSTGARTMMTKCPAAFRYSNPHLNPKIEPTRKRAFDIGSAAHILFLEPELWRQKVQVIDAPDYRTKAAKQQRDAAYKQGMTPLLVAEADQVEAMRAALFDHPVARYAVGNAKTEKTVVWVDEETGCWCKVKIDIWPAAGTYFIDYKSTVSAAPDDCAKSVENYGYHQQMAWYRDGLRAAGAPVEKCYLLFQEKAAPYLIQPYVLSDIALEWGDILNRKARHQFMECLREDQWPGYADRAPTLDLPYWAEARLEAADKEGAFAVPTFDPSAAKPNGDTTINPEVASV